MRRPSIADVRHDEGSAMIAVIMLLMIVMALAMGSVQVAQHTNDVTSVDRERLQTVQAAEAGISEAIRRIEAGGGCDAAATAFADLHDTDDVVGRYRTRVDPEAATTCGQTPRRVIHSWGYAPTGGTRAMRQLEVAVELVPQSGFPYTLMAEGNIGSGAGTIYVKNNGTINGDVYAENLDQTKNNISAETIITPADVVTKNNASYSGTLWAGGNITIGANSNIGESVLTSGTKPGSAGSITFGGGGVVGEDVKAKGTVTLNGQTVNGSVSQNDPNVPAPPNLIKPTFAWNATNYSPAPVQNTAANINTALNTNKNALSGTYYNNSGSSSAITVPDNAKVTGNLTIVSTGRVILGNSLTAIGGPWTVVIIAQSPAADAIDVAKAFTASSGIHLLLYAIGGVDMKNNMSLTGAIYANQIDAKNTFGIGRSTVLAQATLPGFTWDFSSSSVFSAVPTLWREVAPGAPPA